MTTDHSGDRPTERVEFETANVARVPRRSLLFTAGWVVLLGGVVAVGLGGRSADIPADTTDAARPAGADAEGRATGVPTDGGPRRKDVVLSRRFDPAFPSLIIVQASESGPISVLATRRPSMVTVIGAVSLQQVARILVSMQSLDGQPAGSASTLFPQSATDGRDHLPPLGFNLRLAVPAKLADRVVVVQTSAYDTRGRLLATTRAQLAPEL